MNVAIVTASTNPFKTLKYWDSWRRTLSLERENAVPLVLVVNHKPWYNAHADKLLGTLRSSADIREGDTVIMVDDYLGTVPAFARGYESALRLEPKPDIICCFHDDLEILEERWDFVVEEVFRDNDRCVLAGFGGALGVGEPGMYERGFDPMTLARHDFGSSMRDAEVHGARWSRPRRVAVLDGFSQIFLARAPGANPFRDLAASGVIHHAYDVALGAAVHVHGMETWFCPVACHHAGGQTAVGDPGYQTWARTKHPDGDQGLWLEAHRIVYEAYRGVLPFSVADLS